MMMCDENGLVSVLHCGYACSSHDDDAFYVYFLLVLFVRSEMMMCDKKRRLRILLRGCGCKLHYVGVLHLLYVLTALVVGF